MSTSPTAAGRRFVADFVLIYVALSIADLLFGEDPVTEPSTPRLRAHPHPGVTHVLPC